MKWRNSSPQGNILVDVVANDNDGYIVHVRYDVSSDHDSRASEVSRLAAESMEQEAVEIIQSYMKD